jgi:hypothetical protein
MENWALEQAEVWWFPFRELTTHGTPDEKKGAGKATFSEGNTEIRATERVKKETTPG